MINETAVKASYALSHLIACSSKPFTDGQFIKECLIKHLEGATDKRLNTWYANLRNNFAVLKTISLNLLCSRGYLLSM
jgi:hypothetical protein